MSVLVNPTALAAMLDAGQPVRLLDVRWRLGGPPGVEEYLAGHIPGAVHVDLDADLAGPPSPAAGRHPLPDAADLQRAARRLGIDDGDTVVAYDDDGNRAAARAWWLLRWAGLPRVLLLDGGLAAWRRAGLPVVAGPQPPVAEGGVHLAAGRLATLTADDAARLAGSGLLLDARAPERYRGEHEPIDPRAGHIPGARNAPTGWLLADDNTFLPAETLAARFAEVGLADGVPVGVYCGSGVTAAHVAAALAVLGVDAALYPGSWSQWSADPSRPVATGPDA